MNKTICSIERKNTLYVGLQVKQIGQYNWNVTIYPIYKKYNNNEDNLEYELKAYNESINKITNYFERNNYYWEIEKYGEVVNFKISKEIKRDKVFMNKCKSIINSEFRYLNGYCVL